MQKKNTLPMKNPLHNDDDEPVPMGEDGFPEMEQFPDVFCVDRPHPAHDGPRGRGMKGVVRYARRGEREIARVFSWNDSGRFYCVLRDIINDWETRLGELFCDNTTRRTKGEFRKLQQAIDERALRALEAAEVEWPGLESEWATP